MTNIITSLNPGTQTPLKPSDIPAPDYELHEWEIESTVDELLDQAVRLGETHSQMRIAAGRPAAPMAHTACTSYHAIECIRFLQKKLVALQAKYETLEDRYENVLLEAAGDDA